MYDINFFNNNQFYIMHYSSSNISKSPVEISCIVILNGLKPDEEKVFSRVDYKNDNKLVKDFLNYFKNINDPILTWNMKKGVTYGPLQILRRYKKPFFGKKPWVDLNQFYDLDALFKNEFGRDYIGHPKMITLAIKNSLRTLNFRSGLDEANFFDEGNFREIEMSCTRKTYLISDFIKLSLKNQLKIEPQHNPIKTESDIKFNQEVIDEIDNSKILLRLQEAWSCHKNECYEAGAVMLRKALEASLHIAFKQLYNTDDALKNKVTSTYFQLSKKLDITNGKGLLSTSIYDNLKSYAKFFGDLAAHDINVTISQSDFERANSSLEKALEHLFTKVNDKIYKKN